MVYTVDEVAELLKIPKRTVYKHARRLGGFYPAGIKVLRFRKQVIDEILYGTWPTSTAGTER